LNFIFNPICKPFCLKIDPKELIWDFMLNLLLTEAL
jgi:hypothetical protein